MGAGGLLKEMKSRPAPRNLKAASGIGKVPQSPPRIAALVLAAGQSSRMGSINKLLAAMPDGRSMIAHTVDNVLASAARPVIVVTGHQDREIRNALAGKPVRFLHAADHTQGLSASIKAGISAISDEIGAAILCLGDMPLIGPEIFQSLRAAYDPAANQEIIIPVFDGQRGNPVLWGKRFFPEFLKLSGDTGARQIMHLFKEFITEVAVGSDAVLCDFDTPEMMAVLTETTT
jgi:molybdenum cofactor cytidylyltransferase